MKYTITASISLEADSRRQALWMAAAFIEYEGKVSGVGGATGHVRVSPDDEGAEGSEDAG